MPTTGFLPEEPTVNIPLIQHCITLPNLPFISPTLIPETEPQNILSDISENSPANSEHEKLPDVSPTHPVRMKVKVSSTKNKTGAETVKKIIQNVLIQNGVDGLYDLEWSDNYLIDPNPIVYSRTGRATYGSIKTSNMLDKHRVQFDAKDLKKILERPLLLQSKARPTFKWAFMEDSYKIEPYYQLSYENDKTLIFESRFESGNLSLAVKLSDSEYYLLMQNDALTKGHTQCIFR